MKKPAKGTKASADGTENEIREILREFARKALNTPKLREAAAKKTGAKPSYIRAMLSQRGVGGLSSWIPLVAYCFELLDLNLTRELARALANPEALTKSSGLTASEQVFRNLDQIPIVSEDVKFQLAKSLEMMLRELETSFQSGRKKR